jgi:hypothetical protein
VRRPCINCGHELDLTTDEERAVIDAADTYVAMRETLERGDPAARQLAVSVAALRASRQPKPRYWNDDVNIHAARFPCYAKACSVGDAERIARLLNEDEAKR